MSARGKMPRETRLPIVAIDGPVGSGKSSIARRAAELLGYRYVDTGAMYRALGLASLRAGLPLDDAAQLESLAASMRIELNPQAGRGGVTLDGEDVTGAIRAAEVAQAASRLATIPGVRRVMVAEQQRMGSAGGVVMEGRDIASVVFPDAELKIYLTASLEERARRRMREHAERGEACELAEIIEEVRERDRRDQQRKDSPLMRTQDAVLVDNTAMDAEETARLIAMLVHQAGKEQPSLT
jgi:cytidylate kinase